jgi:hypothetical protein
VCDVENHQRLVDVHFGAGPLAWQANASTFDFSFTGPGVSGTVELTYDAATDAKYPQAFEVTGISGTFSDWNNGLSIVNAPIGPLEPIKHDTPDSTNLLAPHDFSRFAVAAGLSPISNGFLTYDNLFYPGGSPQTATDYPLHGGLLDIYGLLFDIGGSRVVDFWSNGTPSGTGHINYGSRGRHARHCVGLCHWWRVGDSRARRA